MSHVCSAIGKLVSLTFRKSGQRYKIGFANIDFYSETHHDVFAPNFRVERCWELGKNGRHPPVLIEPRKACLESVRDNIQYFRLQFWRFKGKLLVDTLMCISPAINFHREEPYGFTLRLGVLEDQVPKLSKNIHESNLLFLLHLMRESIIWKWVALIPKMIPPHVEVHQHDELVIGQGQTISVEVDTHTLHWDENVLSMQPIRACDWTALQCGVGGRGRAFSDGSARESHTIIWENTTPSRTRA